MIWDKQLLCSDAQAITVDAVSTNTIDLGSSADIGRGGEQPMRARVQIDAAAVRAAGAANVNFQLISSASADLSTPTVLFATGDIAKATLVAGYIPMDIVVPSTAQRYLGFYYDTSATLDALSVTAGLLLDTPSPLASRPLGETGL